MKWVKVHHGQYEINRKGVVRRVTGASGTRAGNVLKPYQNPNHYVSLCVDSQRTVRSIASLLEEAFGKTTKRKMKC